MWRDSIIQLTVVRFGAVLLDAAPREPRKAKKVKTRKMKSVQNDVTKTPKEVPAEKPGKSCELTLIAV
jgi:hypothetical protein